MFIQSKGIWIRDIPDVVTEIQADEKGIQMKIDGNWYYLCEMFSEVAEEMHSYYTANQDINRRLYGSA